MDHEAWISSADARFLPVSHSKTFNNILTTLGLRTKRVLDLGCGYGTHLVHFGKGSIGFTINQKQVDYGRERGLAIRYGNVEAIDQWRDTLGQFDAIWANNIFEHLLSPHSFLVRLKAVADANTILILGVPVLPRITSLTQLRKFRGALATGHIDFFTLNTLRLSVERAGWIVHTTRPFVFSIEHLDKLCAPIMPHVYVVAKNDEQFRYDTKHVSGWQEDPLYSNVLSTVQGAGL